MDIQSLCINTALLINVLVEATLHTAATDKNTSTVKAKRQ